MMNRSYVCWALLGFAGLTACGDSAPVAERMAPPDPADTVALASAGEGEHGLAAPQSALRYPADVTEGRQPASTTGSGTGAEPATARDGGQSSRPAQPTSGPASEPAADADANAILRRAEQVYEGVRTLEADFSQQVTVPLLDQTQRSTGKIYHRRPDRFAMRFSDPAGDLIVADGKSLWMYYPSTDAKQVIRSDLARSGQQVDLQREFLSDATTRFHAVLTGIESVAGRPAHLLVLTPRGESPYRRVRLWIDQQDHLVRRFEILEQNDSLRRLELRNIRANTTLSDDLFRFTPPPGTQVFEH